MKYPEKKLDTDWITGEKQLDIDFVNWAKSFGEFLAKNPKDKFDIKPLSGSQIRKFFGELKKIQANFEDLSLKIPLLIPKLAYAVGRDYDNKKQRAKSRIQEFYEEISKGIEKVQNEDEFERFVSIVESIVAYHKFYGGSSN